ncbi:MAG: hypothetical protein ACR5LF_04270 [Symbiopectobacterium sp.]
MKRLLSTSVKRLLSTLILATLTVYAHAAPAARDVTMTTASQQDTDASLAKKHPSELYLHSKQLFETGHCLKPTIRMRL